MLSLWADRTQLPHFAALEEDCKTEVLVIGGGMAGILCAYFLKKAGVDCILAEADVLCGRNTQNTTAKITAQHGLIYEKLLQEKGMEQARQYLEANLEAAARYRQLCEALRCPLEKKDSYVYSKRDQGKLERELAALEQLGYRAYFADALPLPFSVVGAVRFPDQAQFDPMQFVSCLLEDCAGALGIYEHTAIREIRGKEAVTERGAKITADSFIVATHFPFLNKYGLYFLKMYQERSYCIALENAADVAGMYRDGEKNGLSFRNDGQLLLVGGGGHRTGKEGGCWQELRDFAGRFYPKAKERYAWAAQDCITLDGVPYIGRYAKSLSCIYVATGFNKWGMTGSMAAAQILTDLVQGKENPYAELFSPGRGMKLSALAKNGGSAVANLLSFSKKRCPHLGCALQWNSAEHSWDCPCHGSRFGKDGTLLDNPATGRLHTADAAAELPH